MDFWDIMLRYGGNPQALFRMISTIQESRNRRPLLESRPIGMRGVSRYGMSPSRGQGTAGTVPQKPTKLSYVR